MTPKKDEYMRGYGDGFRDGAAHAAKAKVEQIAESIWQTTIDALTDTETCPVCRGDCASANPPMGNACPMQHRGTISKATGGAS